MMKIYLLLLTTFFSLSLAANDDFSHDPNMSIKDDGDGYSNYGQGCTACHKIEIKNLRRGASGLRRPGDPIGIPTMQNGNQKFEN